MARATATRPLGRWSLPPTLPISPDRLAPKTLVLKTLVLKTLVLKALVLKALVLKALVPPGARRS